ncbi:hypothetical protein, partial [Croceivirga sp. JEA036]|uniref:hypothetical protein n=1 Tax=Croceivirga sp. JEA036 TaxID=2721162 RepID=UPI001ADC28EA
YNLKRILKILKVQGKELITAFLRYFQLIWKPIGTIKKGFKSINGSLEQNKISPSFLQASVV